MCLKFAIDFAPQVTEEVFEWLDNDKVYLDDIGFFFKTWEKHLLVIEKVLSENGFSVTPSSANGFSSESIGLNMWLAPTGLKSQKKHISVIIAQ